jgi:ATP-dependent Clp protease ATP-binding subunit ClpA
MNRLDKVVVFRPLGDKELRRILDLELQYVQRRVFQSNPERTFIFTLSEPAKTYLLSEGTDIKYGARHLKRAIERLLVQPLSNLIATQQVRGGDWIKVDLEESTSRLAFVREAESLPTHVMAEMAGTTALLGLSAAASRSVTSEPARLPQRTLRRN